MTKCLCACVLCCTLFGSRAKGERLKHFGGFFFRLFSLFISNKRFHKAKLLGINIFFMKLDGITTEQRGRHLME